MERLFPRTAHLLLHQIQLQRLIYCNRWHETKMVGVAILVRKSIDQQSSCNDRLDWNLYDNLQYYFWHEKYEKG